MAGQAVLAGIELPTPLAAPSQRGGGTDTPVPGPGTGAPFHPASLTARRRQQVKWSAAAPVPGPGTGAAVRRSRNLL